MRRVVAMDDQGNIALSIVNLFSQAVHIDQKVATSSPDKETLLKTPEGQIFEWYTDGILIVEEHPDRVILRAPQYGLFSDIWRSPISAQAMRTDCGFQTLTRLPRTEQFNSKTELSIGFSKGFLLE